MDGISDTILAAGQAWSDFLYRATFGQPAPDQVKQIANDTYNQVIRAGGSAKQAQQAADQAAGVVTAGGASNSALWLLAAAGLGTVLLFRLLE